MIAIPQATAALYIPKTLENLLNFSEFKYAFTNLQKKYMKFNCLTVCETFFKLTFRKFI